MRNLLVYHSRKYNRDLGVERGDKFSLEFCVKSKKKQNFLKVGVITVENGTEKRTVEQHDIGCFFRNDQNLDAQKS